MYTGNKDKENGELNAFKSLRLSNMRERSTEWLKVLSFAETINDVQIYRTQQWLPIVKALEPTVVSVMEWWPNEKNHRVLIKWNESEVESLSQSDAFTLIVCLGW